MDQLQAISLSAVHRLGGHKWPCSCLSLGEISAEFSCLHRHVHDTALRIVKGAGLTPLTE